MQLARNLNLDMSNLGITQLDGFDGLDVKIRHLNASGNGLFLQQFVDFTISSLDLSNNEISDEVLWTFLNILGYPEKGDAEEALEQIEEEEKEESEIGGEEHRAASTGQQDNILNDSFIEIADPGIQLAKD